MYTVEDAYGPASNLYWIAFLLTGRSELSLNVILEVLDSENGLDLISSPQTLPGVRTRVIIRALAAIREEVSAWAQQAALQSSDPTVLSLSSWPIGPNITQAQLEEAILDIDVFSRCALLLTVFEGLTVDEAAELLYSNREMIDCGREGGLRELTRNLSSITSDIPLRLERMGEPALLS